MRGSHKEWHPFLVSLSFRARFIKEIRSTIRYIVFPNFYEAPSSAFALLISYL